MDGNPGAAREEIHIGAEVEIKSLPFSPAMMNPVLFGQAKKVKNGIRRAKDVILARQSEINSRVFEKFDQNTMVHNDVVRILGEKEDGSAAHESERISSRISRGMGGVAPDWLATKAPSRFAARLMISNDEPSRW